MNRTSSTGIALIAYFEQYHDGDMHQIGLQPKMCPAGIWTVGLGHALINKKTGKWLKGHGDYREMLQQYPEYITMTKQQADELLRQDLLNYENKVQKGLKVAVNQAQFDALVSFCYNCGWSETLFRMINGKEPTEKIVSWWQTHYITGNGKVLKGLIFRRKVESEYFRTGKVTIKI